MASKNFLSLLAICCVILSFVYPAAPEQFLPTQSYMREEFLNFEKSMKLFWNYDDQEITFELHAKTFGWIGLGISPAGGMRDADIWVGWIQGGKAEITDRHGPPYGNSFPTLDSEQNIELLEGRECEGKMLLKFKRKLVACDVNDRTITGGTMRVIAAYGLWDPYQGFFTYFHQHSYKARWTKNIILLSGPVVSDQPTMTHTSSFEIRNNGTAIPRLSTYYNCRLIQLPEFKTKNHIVRIEPVINSKYTREVHHMSIASCPFPPSNPSYIGQNFQCYDRNTPREVTICPGFIATWGVGQEAFNFPQDTGFPLGAADSPRYVVLETHYDNPTLKDIQDTSGLRFIFTSDLRKYDSGTTIISHLVSGFEQVIPPMSDSFMTYGECDNSCIESAMTSAKVDEINIFGVFPHSHLAGSGMTLQHFRNSEELPPVTRDDSYDFNYQEYRHLRQHRVVKKGDTLVTRCEYNTLGRTKATTGGLTTKQEMCIMSVYYYPAIPLSICSSTPSPPHVKNLLKETLGVTDVTQINTERERRYRSLYDVIITAPEKLANQSMGEAVSKYPWTKDKRDLLSEEMHKMSLRKFCVGPGPSRPKVFFGSPLLTSHPYTQPSPQCNVTMTSRVKTITPADCVTDIAHLVIP